DIKKPKRGRSAFETDLCVFESIDNSLKIPRVVLEFKGNLTTHDVLTYSAKARKHKQVYPYLRYGLVLSGSSSVPGRFFTHNEALDFCVAAKSYGENRLQDLFARLLEKEVATSRHLESIAFGQTKVDMYRLEVVLGKETNKVY
ncbi:MAG: hypothetical protein ACYC9M_08820, partial [Desulfobulbaceae bacterium]